MRKLHKERLKGAIGIICILFAIGMFAAWESYGREAFTYDTVLVFNQDVEKGTRTRRGDGFEVTEQDTRRGNIINNYQQIENVQSNKAIMDVLDSVCSRKEDKEHLLSVLMRNQWPQL